MYPHDILKRKIYQKGQIAFSRSKKGDHQPQKEKDERVADLAKEYGFNPESDGYLSRSGRGSGTLLELAKLKREKDSLLKIVGQLIVDQKLGKKEHRYGR